MNTPKSNLEKMQRILKAWQDLAEEKVFGGVTLAQYEPIVGAAVAARTDVKEKENQLAQAINTRDTTDETGLAKTQLVVNGVLGDPTEGPDSTLYEAMGYTRKSERKSGLSRKKTPPPLP